MNARRCPCSRVDSSATSLGARTCAESIGFSRRPNPLPPRQVPKKSTQRPDLCRIDGFLPVIEPIPTTAGTQKVDTKAGTLKIDSAPGLVPDRWVSPGDRTHPHHSRYPKSRLFGYLPGLLYLISCTDLPSDVSSCPQGAAHGLGYNQVPQVSAPGLVLKKIYPITTKAGTKKVDFLGTSQMYHAGSLA